MNRKQIADHIVARLKDSIDVLRADYQKPNQIPSFVVNDLLPKELAISIYEAFPSKEKMMFRNTLREQKYVTSQMNQHAPLLEEIVFAFQDPEVVRLIEEITAVKPLHPDKTLYAGGLSYMEQGNFLNLHLDNSHDHGRKMYRVMNLLYYVTPEWTETDGGHLELWDQGVKSSPRVIPSNFNRLVVMATGKKSWHSVNQIMNASKARCCVSNYYFSPSSIEGESYYHVTSFRGRPEQKFRDCFLQLDNLLRLNIRKVFKGKVQGTKHIYKQDSK